MKLRWWSLPAALVLAAAFAVVPAHADRGGYTIHSFHTELTVRPDAVVQVEERIEVDFSAPRHGIYRVIPVRYTDPMGYAYSLGFRFGGVADARGRPHKVKVTGKGRYVRIRIGDPKRTVSGRVVYVLRYQVRNALGHFPDHDEIYWNATGNEWNAAIRRASATVRLPEGAPPGAVEAAGYTGKFGSRGHDVRVSRSVPGAISFEATRPLGALEGMTVAVGWPPGFVRFPGRVARAVSFLGNNWILAIPLIVLGFLWRTYRKKGRDPEGRGSVVVRYEPPEGVTPAEIGTLVDEKVDPRDITSTVVDLAVRGYLKIRVEEKEKLFGLFTHEETVFERVPDRSTEKLRRHEKLVLDGLFENGDEVTVSDLTNRFYKHLPDIQKALYRTLVERRFFASDPQKVRQGWAGAGVGAGVLTAAAGIAWTIWRGGIFPNAVIAPVAAAVVTLVLFLVFARAMPRRTRAGVEMRRWALGFEEFVDRVESERLEADRRRNVFESLLPYAMALGVAAAWARKFEGIYAAGAAAPVWYVGAHPGSIPSTGALERSLSSAMTRAGQAMAASPRSSGSGGGGFSGGGGGGGGGGSW